MIEIRIQIEEPIATNFVPSPLSASIQPASYTAKAHWGYVAITPKGVVSLEFKVMVERLPDSGQPSKSRGGGR
jgi:hypothetical protein